MISRRLLNKTLTFLRFHPADGSWADVDRYEKDTVSYPCRIQPVSQSEYLNGKIRSEADFVVFLDYIEGVSSADRITIDGCIYEIVEVKNAAGHSHHLELGVKKL